MPTVDVLVGDDDPPQAVNRLRPITLTTSRSSSCDTLRRFFQPRKHRAAANVAPPGRNGFEL